MEYEDIKEGDRAEFIIKAERKRGSYSSTTIFEVSDQQKIFTIECPRVGNSIFRFSSNESYIFCFYEGNQCYACECLFSREKKTRGKYYAMFRVVSPFSKIERRKSSRIPLTIPIRYSLINNDGTIVDPENTLEGVSINISNGGMYFANDRELNVGDIVYLMIEKSSGPLITKATVVNQMPVAIHFAGEYPYHTSVRFIEKQVSRRKNTRYKCNYPLRYSVMNDALISNPEEVHEGELCDISKGGMRFSGDIMLTKHTHISCVVSTPGVLLMVDGVVTNEKSRLIIEGERRFETSVRFTRVTQAT